MIKVQCLGFSVWARVLESGVEPTQTASLHMLNRAYSALGSECLTT